MNYQIFPMGKIWEKGMFSVPSLVAKNYIKLASEYQLKALLLILSNGGNASSREIAKTLGCTESDADDFLEFWVDEGVLTSDSAPAEPPKKVEENKPEVKKEKKEPKKTFDALPAPNLTPEDIIAAARDPEIAQLLQSAQEVFGRTISHAEEALIINMVQHYGLPSEVALTVLHYCIGEKNKGKAIGNAYIASMAKNWSEEGITTLDAAEEKLQALENSNRLWTEILAAGSIKYRNPSVNQRAMLKRWSEDFSVDIIFYACEVMCETAENPSTRYLDGIFKNWKKAGVKTLDDAKALCEKGKENSTKKKTGSSKLKGDPSFDINEIEKKALFNDDYNI